MISRYADQLARFHRSLLVPSDQQTLEWRPIVMLLTVALSLLLMHYMKYGAVLHQLLRDLARKGDSMALFASELLRSDFYLLYQHLWWGGWHLLGYLLIPLLVIKWLFRDSLREYGFTWGETHRYLLWYGALAGLILTFAWFASARADFSSHYPFYRLASRSWFDLLAWESIYIMQFICLEFFFRGFMLNAAKRTFGLYAIFIMMLPYLMLHFQKPWLEASGALFFGLILGYLALHSRSIWGGVMVHVTIALGMDLMALLRTDRLPQHWWPI
ncbi:MAG: CPBP family intramembrane metalloprotease [Candidatus Polarisedimenticolaceae bacterium]|nr:CPBP family intramembrane metalloprotease [Candidatus Polarisedimenticolaceae bacterium]